MTKVFGDNFTPQEVEVIDLNSFTDEAISNLDPYTADLVKRRNAVMGPAYRLVFQEPFQPVRASGTRMYDANNTEYLDVYNNVVSLGHNNSKVVQAVEDQFERINTNTRYLQEDIIVYAEHLVSTHSAGLTNVMFTCTGSEANDLAMRMAKVYTKATGVIVTDYAYHGNTTEVSSWSPASGKGNFLGDHVRTVMPPDYFRNPDGAFEEFLAAVKNEIISLERHGVGLAAVVIDPIFSSDGIYPAPELLPQLVRLVHDHGGLVICDEVQAGFSRTGKHMWGYQNAGIEPDLVTMGKPMGNGIPIGGVVAKRKLIESFAQAVAYFNTFGGENIPVAAAQAVLNYVQEEELGQHVEEIGNRLASGIREILRTYRIPSDVRHIGLYLGVEFVIDLESKAPDLETTTRVINRLKDRRIITSAAGKYGNVIKVRPPLVFDQTDLDWFLKEFEFVIKELTEGANAPKNMNHTGVSNNSTALRRMILEELESLLGEVRRG